MNLKEQKMEEIIYREEQALAELEKHFIKDIPNFCPERNLQRGYISLKRSLDYLNKYLEERQNG
jgi:hypothetical protein